MLYGQKCCQYRLKGKETGWNKGRRLLDFWDSTRESIRVICLWMCVICQGKGRGQQGGPCHQGYRGNRPGAGLLWCCFLLSSWHHGHLLGFRGWGMSSIWSEQAATTPGWGERLPLLCFQTSKPPQLAWRTEHWTKENYSQNLRSNGICPAKFCTWDPSVLSFLWFLPFEMGLSILCLSHHGRLERDNLLSGFTDFKLERNFLPQDELYFKSHSQLI